MNAANIAAIVRAIRRTETRLGNTTALSMTQVVEVAEYIAAKHEFLADAINEACQPYRRANGALHW